MPSTFFGLTIGKTGLNIASAGINTTAHNVANATTKGYTRQEISSAATTPLSLYTRAGMAGTGVQLTGVERQRNQYYDDKYRVSNSAYGNYQSKEYYMNALQTYFAEPNKDSKGINYCMNQFNAAMENLKNNPSSSDKRTQFIEAGNGLTDMVNYLSNSMLKLQKEANTEIKTTAERINSIAAQLATLNKQINTLEIQGGMANDLRDERDVLLDELSEYGNISTMEVFQGDDKTVVNQFVVMLDGKILVDTNNYNTLVVSSMDGRVGQNDMDCMYQLTWSDTQEFNSASPTLGGKLQALFEVRDGNNQTNFTGTSENTKYKDDSVTVKGASCNDLKKLNIPESNGMIKIGAVNYTYTDFSVTIEADGSYSYTFNGLVDEDGVKGISKVSNGGTMDVSIGSSINYKGIPYYQAQLNEFVRTLASEMNMIHNTGQDQTLNQAPGLDFFNGKNPVSGESYELLEDGYTVEYIDANGVKQQKSMKVTSFSSTGGATGVAHYTGENGVEVDENYVQKANRVSYYNVTAMNFSVTDKIQNNIQLLATTSNIDSGVEATDVIDKMIDKMKDKSMFKEGRAAEFLQTFTSNIATDTAQSILFRTSQENINNAIDQQRMSVSSVDKDEEAMKLVKYQNAYELNAKIISTMSQLYDILLNM